MKFSRSTVYGIFVSVVFSGALAKPVPVPVPHHGTADIEADPSTQSKPYIFMLSDSETRPVAEVARSMGYNGTDLLHVWDTASFRGFSVKMHKTNALSLFDANDNLDCMEPDMEMKLSVEPYDKEIYGKLARREDEEMDLMKRQAQNGGNQDLTNVFLQQLKSPWNLERVSCEQRIEQGNRQATDIDYQYRFSASAGKGVDVYMIDTGINVDNVDFEGRATNLFSVDGNFQDFEGHGTHTAGTVGSKTFGVAKQVNLFAVKVFNSDGSGSLTGTINGIMASLKRHNSRVNDPDFMGSILSMSLGAPGRSQSMLRALDTATKAGIHVSVAAGNDNADACGFTPSGLSTELPIISVGATTIQDTRASFSNFGKCAQVFAPGTQITSTFNQGPNSVKVLQGTSMACPLVTGLMAHNLVFRQDQGFKTNPAKLKEFIINTSINNVISENARAGATPGQKILVNNGFLDVPKQNPTPFTG